MKIELLFLIFILIFVLIFVLIKILMKKIVYPKNPCTTEHYELTKEELQQTKELLIEFLRFADETKLEYFAIAGTLIGAARHGGLIPWDDDVDMGVVDSQIPIIESYKSDKFYISNEGFGYKLRSGSHTLSLDIMVFKFENGMYRIMNGIFKSEAIKKEELLVGL